MYDILTKSTNYDQDKNSKYDFLLSRILDVDDHLNDVSDQTGKKYNIIKENVLMSNLD